MFNVKFLLVITVFIISAFLAPASYAVNYEDCGDNCYEESSSRQVSPPVQVQVQHEAAITEEASKSVPWYTYYWNSTKTFTKPLWSPIGKMLSSTWEAIGKILWTGSEATQAGLDATGKVFTLTGAIAWILKWLVYLSPLILLVVLGVAAYTGRLLLVLPFLGGAIKWSAGLVGGFLGAFVKVFLALLGKRGL